MATKQVEFPTSSREWTTDRQVRQSRWSLRLMLAVIILFPLVAWGVNNWSVGRTGADPLTLMTHQVQRQDMRMTVVATGSLASASSVDVFSEVEGQVAIISLMPRGTRVKQGDVVVELDSSALKTRSTQQRILIEQARNSQIQAKQALQLAESQAESDIRTAELAVKFAELDLRKYLEADYPQLLRIAESEITLAEEELKRARERVNYSEELKQLGYLSEGQVDADKLTVLRSEIKEKLARGAEQVLREFTLLRTKQEMESKVEEANRSLKRAKNLAQGTVEQAKSALHAQQSTLELEEGKLQHIQIQIENCTMRAPQAGVLLYPIPEDEDQEELYIKQGGIVHERQHVFSIPDTDVLHVHASIHEAMVKKVKAGKKARIWVDAFPDLELTGEVKSVSDLPDPQSWRKSTVKFYECTLTIEEQAAGILPGMNAKVEILIKELDDVLVVPVQSVMRVGDEGYCYVIKGANQPQLRRVRLGKSNDRFIEVAEGVAAGEQIVLSPDELGLPAEIATADASQF